MKDKKEKSIYNKQWILDTGIPIVESYNGNLTLRALHYRLVANGMTNDTAHYKKVVATMGDARWEGLIEFDAFLDHERTEIGTTKYEETSVDERVERVKDNIRYWAKAYFKNRWENQPYYPEIWIEKKALQGVFDSVCKDNDVMLCPCKGYPSLTFQHNAKLRFEQAESQGKTPLILYFGDYDCSGEDIPRSIEDTLKKMGVEVEVKRIALMEHQVIEWKLPPAPTKETDSMGANWNGLGQVELDAVEPKAIKKLCQDAIDDIFDSVLYKELLIQQSKERQEYREILRNDFNSILDEE